MRYAPAFYVLGASMAGFVQDPRIAMASHVLLDLYVDRMAYSVDQVILRTLNVYGFMEDPVQVESDSDGIRNMGDDDVAMVNGMLIRPRNIKITGFSITRRAGEPVTWTNAHRLVRDSPLGSQNIVTVHFTKGEAITSVSIYTSHADRDGIQAGPDHFRPDGSIGLNLVPLCSAMILHRYREVHLGWGSLYRRARHMVNVGWQALV